MVQSAGALSFFLFYLFSFSFLLFFPLTPQNNLLVWNGLWFKRPVRVPRGLGLEGRCIYDGGSVYDMRSSMFGDAMSLCKKADVYMMEDVYMI